jgi:hypothetical protein
MKVFLLYYFKKNYKRTIEVLLIYLVLADSFVQRFSVIPASSFSEMVPICVVRVLKERKEYIKEKNIQFLTKEVSYQIL